MGSHCLLGHSMSSQHKKILTSSDFDETWWPVSSIKKPLHTKFQLLNCYSFSTATNLILASGARFRPRAMTEIPISSDVINVESCNKDFLETLERLFHLAYNSLTFDLFKVQRLCNLTFDLGSGKTKVLIFFKLFLQRP